MRVISHSSSRKFLIAVFRGRIRHKKCDETRPVCVNCSRTGRKCDGYAEIQPPKRSSVASSSRNVQALVLKANMGLSRNMADAGKVGLSTDECFFLDLLRNVGVFDNASVGPCGYFADVLARQLGESQPSIKHAALALTANHSRAEGYWNRCGDAGEKSLKIFSLTQTGKSLTALLQQPVPKDLTGRRSHREVIMTTCGLLACVHLSIDDHAAFEAHMVYGQRAMDEWQDADFDGSSIGPTLSTVLARLSIPLQLSSNPALFLRDDSPFLVRALEFAAFDISTADFVVNTFWKSWGKILFTYHANSFRSTDLSSSGSVLKDYTISNFFNVRRFERQLRACIEQFGPSAPQSLQVLLTLLGLWEQVACAVVTAALADAEDAVSNMPLEMRYDALWAYFRCANELGKKSLRSQTRQNALPPAFPIDDAVGTPLLFCGFYCRDWSIRREALHILKAWNERFKGLDTAAFLPMKISALECIIDKESQGLQPGDVVPVPARIRFVRFTGCPGSADIQFSYRQLGMNEVVDILYETFNI